MDGDQASGGGFQKIFKSISRRPTCVGIRKGKGGQLRGYLKRELSKGRPVKRGTSISLIISMVQRVSGFRRRVKHPIQRASRSRGCATEFEPHALDFQNSGYMLRAISVAYLLSLHFSANT